MQHLILMFNIFVTVLIVQQRARAYTNKTRNEPQLCSQYATRTLSFVWFCDLTFCQEREWMQAEMEHVFARQAVNAGKNNAAY